MVSSPFFATHFDDWYRYLARRAPAEVVQEISQHLLPKILDKYQTDDPQFRGWLFRETYQRLKKTDQLGNTVPLLTSLTTYDQELLRLRYFEHCSLDEMAYILSRPARWLEKDLNLALNALKLHLS